MGWLALAGVLLFVFNWFAFQFPRFWLIRELDDWGALFGFRSFLIENLFGWLVPCFFRQRDARRYAAVGASPG